MNVRQYEHMPKNDNICFFVIGFGKLLMPYSFVRQGFAVWCYDMTQKRNLLFHKL